LIQFSCLTKRLAVAISFNVVQYTHYVFTATGIIVRTQEPEALVPVYVYQLVDLLPNVVIL